MKYYVQALRQSGIDVHVRNDLDQALEDFKAGLPWDGAIVDIMFTNPPPPRYRDEDPTGMDVGPLVVRDLRKIQPDLKVIALTAIPTRPVAQALGGVAGVCLIAKSIDVFEFRDTVLRFFGKSWVLNPASHNAA
jgi:CheY-like chemotaxis protein